MPKKTFRSEDNVSLQKAHYDFVDLATSADAVIEIDFMVMCLIFRDYFQL